MSDKINSGQIYMLVLHYWISGDRFDYYNEKCKNRIYDFIQAHSQHIFLTKY